MDLTDKERQAIKNKHNLTDPEKILTIKELDLEVWKAFVPRVKAHEKNSNTYWCYCPYCEKGKKKESVYNHTGLVYEHANGDGLGFACKACGTKHPRVYKFLCEGSAASEEYAWKRFAIDAVGKGWYCPYQQRWKDISEKVRKNRAAKHKAKDERLKKEHQIAHTLREEDKLK